MDMRLIKVDQVMTVPLSAVQQRVQVFNKGRSVVRMALPSSFLAFCHDKSSRCRMVRMVSRQQQRPNRARTNPPRRRNVQRGFGSAPTMGGQAACWCAARTS
jgi:hypothetical protein